MVVNPSRLATRAIVTAASPSSSASSIAAPTTLSTLSPARVMPKQARRGGVYVVHSLCMTYTIEARGLMKAFGPTRVLDGLDLRVGAGEVFALLGPNGAGKTTTVRILATLLTPDEGSARVAGHD